jgi:hypothetical protein
VDALEVDFVAMNQESNTYFQVSATVRGPSTLTVEYLSERLAIGSVF